MRPQRGQSELIAPMVVPQLEQVLTPATFTGGQTQAPAAEPLSLVNGIVPVRTLAQLRRGNIGSEKNSSHNP